ncbi:UDP-4-amino-4,6-dideoxy-N-acetyl-beta-L-altrosamine transaminase [Halalkalibacter lacteus]|uniref:UDP-4-amino-4, 6-dideoxy-N-acetyl-beta-L-altrosamine transaminase n=1 Tax=Halalkalibacter lacteus TaxID=3090663 RepID=UPI002FC89D7B
MSNKSKLAIRGGEAVRKQYLPYGKQWIDDDDIQAVVNVLRSDYITTGPAITKFEEKVANYVGSKYAVAFSSGTAALHAACYAAGVCEDDEVITTPLTFPATANCILYLGGKPVFADVDYNTMNINPSSIRKLITDKTKAVITVHFTGQPVDIDEIDHIAKNHNLIVIEDATHALGASYRSKKIGTFSDMTMFSFHPVKHITTGEGGMITTNCRELKEKLVLFRTHGITRDRIKLIDDHGPWYYEMQFLGYNYRMTDFQASLGISQLKKLDHFISERKKIVSLYNRAFKDLNCLKIPSINIDRQSSWHLYVIRLDVEKLKVGRREIFDALKAENIGVNVHYIPVYYHPYYQKIGYNRGACPLAEQIYEEIITLPLFPSMSQDDAFDVINAVKKVISFYCEQ